MAALNRENKFNTDMTYRDEILCQISSTIEAKIGRTKPTVCASSRYENEKQEIEQQITNKKHFGEKDWPDSKRFFMDSLRTLRFQFMSDDSSSEEEYKDIRHEPCT
jgi:hypothetical protein